MNHFFRTARRVSTGVLTVTIAGVLGAADAGSPAQQLPALQVRAEPSVADRYRGPLTTETITAPRFREAVNVVDAEDAAKYLPSVFLRKRNYGDTQPTLATRVWGVSSSARSLVYVDGLLLSALVANNNTIGAPRWGLVAPVEIERIDLSHGPFSAAYPGNSMGAVMEVTTRLPEQRELSVGQTTAWQRFDLYGTRATLATAETTAAGGARAGSWSFWVSGNFLDTHSQPLSYVTSATVPAGTTGGIRAANKFGDPANVLGATGLLHSRMANGKAKVAYDLLPTLRFTYTLAAWRNKTDAGVETYLRDATGAPTFGGQNAFASGYSTARQHHLTQSASLRSEAKRTWNFEAIASWYIMRDDRQRLPTGVTPTGTGFAATGREVSLDGTGWRTFDVKLHRSGQLDGSPHAIALGAHHDRYELRNPTYALADWQTSASRTGVATEGDGKTGTEALWMQDVWTVSDAVTATLGLRYEDWRGYDGFNANGGTQVRQPDVRRRGTSPKAVVTWRPTPGWTLGLSVGKALRFATAAELYQLVSTGTTFTAPQPDLRPDRVWATEVKLERTLDQGRVRVSVFQDDVRDAIMAQFRPLVAGSAQQFSYLSNVDRVRARGVEAVVERRHLGWARLDVAASVTYLDARTLALTGRPAPNLPLEAALGKRLPNIPDWRATLLMTYRPSERWSLTLGGRYSGMLYTTLDNADVNPNTWQGFAAWFVADVRVHHTLGERWSCAVGADNVLNRKYFLFHPFPQRTFVADVRVKF